MTNYFHAFQKRNSLQFFRPELTRIETFSKIIAGWQLVQIDNSV